MLSIRCRVEAPDEGIIVFRFTQQVYVISDGAHGYYEMESDGPVRITPPYGSPVEVIEDAGEWIRIKAFGKVAWMQRETLSEQRPPERSTFVPILGYSYATIPGSRVSPPTNVEYGPKGGRFTRTKTGYRRYF